jgi:peptidoglycan/LPS O-acetylase OafA/YrhL
MTFEKGQLQSRIPELDGVRGVAILLVVSFHYLEIPADGGGWFGNVARAFLSFGWSGVDLFFVLSGFLIGGIVIDNREATNRFRTFYIRRICRIFPLYFLWLSLYYFLPLLLPTGLPGSSAYGGEIFHFPKWGYIFFLQNFYTAATGDFGSQWMAATWSLAVEEQFYLLLPALIWIALPRKPVRVFVVLIALVPLFRIFLFLFQSKLFLYVLLPCRADALLLGVLCAYLVRLERSYEWLRRNTKMLNAIFLCLLAGVGYLAFLGRGRNAMGILNLFEMATYGFSLVALFYACLLLIATVNRESVIGSFLRIRLLRHFGILAYGIFLTHSAIHAAMLDLLVGVGGTGANKITALSGNFVSLLAFLTTWLLAAFSWRFFEAPIVRWGHTFRYSQPSVGIWSDQQNNTCSTGTTPR